jgi:hypothetical protein
MLPHACKISAAVSSIHPYAVVSKAGREKRGKRVFSL